jgi:hypothetical protein
MTDSNSFRFIGTIAGLRVSNTALYTGVFTPPETFTQSSDTTYLLWNNFKEKVSNTTLTQAGTVTHSNENGSCLPYLMLRRKSPEQSIVAGNFETPLIFNDILESRGLPLINLNSTITTHNQHQVDKLDGQAQCHPIQYSVCQLMDYMSLCSMLVLLVPLPIVICICGRMIE